MKITRVSLLSGKCHTMDLAVNAEQMTRWERGTLAQVAFPHLPAAEREFIISGITPEEWAATFGPDDGDAKPAVRLAS